MKKLIYTLAVILLTSCGAKSSQEAKTVKVQNELVEYLQQYKDGRYDAANSIQREELWQKREDGIVTLQDSIGVFHNIMGHIERIRANDLNNSKVLEFNIEIEPEKYFKITLECTHIVDNDSLETDSLYNTVKALSEYTTVFVDGAIAINSKGVAANASWGDHDLQFSYPEYKFNVVALSTKPLPDISTNLRKAIVAWRHSFEEILKNGGSTDETDKSIEAFKKATEILSPAENEYMGKYVHTCTKDLYRD